MAFPGFPELTRSRAPADDFELDWECSRVLTASLRAQYLVDRAEGNATTNTARAVWEHHVIYHIGICN